MTGPFVERAPDAVVGYRPPEVNVEQRDDGVLILRHPEPAHLTGLLVPQVLQVQAALYPDRTFLKQRHGEEWATITYRDFRDRVNILGGGLIASGLSPGAIVIVVTENSIEAALVTMAVLMAGGVIAPLAPQMLDGDALGVREACVMLDAFALVCDQPAGDLEKSLPLRIALGDNADGWMNLAGLAACGREGANIADRAASLTPDSLAKILFTSGSTGSPKPVINTHGMLSAAQDVSRQLFTQLETEGDEVYRLTDWLPWHHTYGGPCRSNARPIGSHCRSCTSCSAARSCEGRADGKGYSESNPYAS